jgi:alkylhydroperoxidase/carboxymuconolactone decarboxylase family protein YurZ
LAGEDKQMRSWAHVDSDGASARAARGLALMKEMLGSELVGRITERNKIAPNWQRWTTEVLFGDVWQDDTLSRRERSLITIAALVPTTRARELANHMRAALRVNGVTAPELAALIQHVGFYAGWPAVGEALAILQGILAEGPPSDETPES